MPVTIHDVARRAAVSTSTVSRALSASHLVRPDTRERVLAAAKELSYQPNPAARSLITGRTGNLGIVVSDLSNPFYTGVLRGVQARARRSGYAVFFVDAEEDSASEQALVRTMARQVDGVIMCAPIASDPQLYALAEVTSLVLLNRRLGDIPAVLMASANGIRQVLDHLGALGHRRCAYLNGPSKSWSNRERRRGMRSAAARNNIDVIQFGPFEPTFDGGIQAADLAVAGGVTAIMAYNDLMALGVLSRLAHRGVRVPEDMSVVGFDDLLFAAVCSPPLTTVAMPMEAGGRAAVDLLLAGIDGADDDADVHRELSTNLIVRATTTVPPIR
ncbi:LacI family DNA-binding transcriptional regulator [Micromonospora sp. NPDC005215]|uniref:LacI family DNA-binding transcriptional regulator n=1 Tax=Micromonospora sp. NPDC005215 TaxID=3157024 RepID=UPI0033A523B8